MNKPPSSSNQHTVKIHAFLAHAGVTSRRKAEELVSAGKVKINGEIAQIGQRVNPSTDSIEVNGEQIGASENTVAFLVYKPVGVVSTTADELNRQTVVQYLQKITQQALPRLYPVGRLDKDSEGLMILTNNGSLTQRLTHPSYEVPKTYRVTIEGIPSELALDHLRRGVKLKEGYTSPAEVTFLQTKRGPVPHTEVEITIHEGWNQQVRRMFRRVGYEVVRLIRTKMGPYSLEMLGTAKYRQLTEEEVH